MPVHPQQQPQSNNHAASRAYHLLVQHQHTFVHRQVRLSVAGEQDPCALWGCVRGSFQPILIGSVGYRRLLYLRLGLLV